MDKRTRVAVASLTVSAAAVLSVAHFEGFSGKAYRDPVGIPTIGYGETKNVVMGQTITREAATVLLGQRVEEHAKGMAQCIHVPISQDEFDAYADFAYNVGVGAFCRSTLAKKLNSGDYVGACQELLKWVYAGGQVLPGLVTRRKAEFAKCMG